MDELISKQAAIDALGEEPEVWSGNNEYAQGLNNQWHYDINALKALPSAQSEWETGEWTSVSEGLPKADLIGEEFIVTVGERAVGRNFVTVFIWKGADGGWNNGFGWNCEDVIAWMPLPKPYDKKE